MLQPSGGAVYFFWSYMCAKMKLLDSHHLEAPLLMVSGDMVLPWLPRRQDSFSESALSCAPPLKGCFLKSVLLPDARRLAELPFMNPCSSCQHPSIAVPMLALLYFWQSCTVTNGQKLKLPRKIL